MTEALDNHPLFAQLPVGRQAEFHASQADTRLIIAGNRAGKTEAGMREDCFFATGLHPYRDVPVPNTGWIITLDRLFAQDVLLPVVLKFLPKQFIRKIFRGDTLRIELTNDSQIVFRTYGQGWEKFQGAKIHWANFDEECPQAVYDEVMVRLIDYRAPHWMQMTPLHGKTWVYQRFIVRKEEFQPEDLEIFSWSTLENTSLDPKRVEATFGRMPVEIRAARMRGDFVDLEGLVWPHFDEAVHLVNDFRLQPNWPLTVGMDFGFRHPFAAVFLAVDEAGRKIAWRTYRRAERLASQHARSILETFLEYAPHAILDQRVAERVLKAIAEGRVPESRPSIRARFVIDPSAQQCRREFVPYGISADNSDRNVHARIERVGELLLDTVEGRPGLVIMRGRNAALVDEMRSYSWKPKKPGAHDDKPAPPEPQDIHDDAVDALGYGVLAAPGSAPIEASNPPEMSPAWLRQIRERSARIATRMGNERVPPELIQSRMMRLGRRW